MHCSLHKGCIGGTGRYLLPRPSGEEEGVVLGVARYRVLYCSCVALVILFCCHGNIFIESQEQLRKAIPKYANIDQRPPFTYASLIRQVCGRGLAQWEWHNY